MSQESRTHPQPTGHAAPTRSVLLRPGDRLDSVQLLRAIAAVDVVAFHTPAFTPIGSWGVTLFFVISGFIMCYVTEATGSQFIQKRILRIVPLYWAGTLSVFGVALLAPSLLQNTTADVGELIKSLAFIPFYKGQAVTPVLFLGWTLNLEMFFYVLFALSLKLSHRHRAAICSALLLTIAACGQLFRFDSVVLQFFSQPIILDFIFGMVCYWALTRFARRGAGSSSVWRRAWALVGAVLVVSMPLAAGHNPATIGLTPGASSGIALALVASLAFCCSVHGLAGANLPRFAVLIGDASYSLYLFHPYVIQTFVRVFKAFNGGGPVSYALALVAIALCCALSVALYRYVEAPVTKYLRRRLLARGS